MNTVSGCCSCCILRSGVLRCVKLILVFFVPTQKVLQDFMILCAGFFSAQHVNFPMGIHTIYDLYQFQILPHGGT